MSLIDYTLVRFTIGDLSSISGIKTPALRMWEKRYGLLTPERTDTNLRQYDLSQLQKLLNVRFLLQHGHKISKIAEASQQQVFEWVHKEVTKKHPEDYYIDELMLSCIGYDRIRFLELYEELLQQHSFSVVFSQYFVPLLQKIGTLWQTNTVDITQEHFVVQLIKERLLLQLAPLEGKKSKTTSVLVFFFLPENEIHEIGLYFAYYLALAKGVQSVMLGPSVPVSALAKFNALPKEVIYYTHMSHSMRPSSTAQYFAQLSEVLLNQPQRQLWISGDIVQEIPSVLTHPQVRYVGQVNDLEKALNAYAHYDREDSLVEQ